MTPAELEAASFAASELSTMLFKASRRAVNLSKEYVNPTKRKMQTMRRAQLKLATAEALARAKLLAAWIENKENEDEQA